MIMKNIFKVLFLAGLTLALGSGACTGGTERRGADSSAASTAVNEDTTAVEQADSTHSFRNDRGTDSVSAGKSVPSQP